MYILNAGQIAQLLRPSANETEVAGSLSKKMFWEQSSVDPVRKIRTFLLKRPRGLSRLYVFPLREVIS